MSNVVHRGREQGKDGKRGGYQDKGQAEKARLKPVQSDKSQSIDIVSGGGSGKEPMESGGITTGIRGRITGGKSVAGHTQAGKGGLSKARIGLEVIYS